MKHSCILPGIVLVLLAALGCKRGEDLPITTTDWINAVSESSPVAALLRELPLAPTVLTVDLATHPYVEAGGDYLSFSDQKDSATGAEVMGGQVQVEFLHLQKAGDIIRHNQATLELIRSGSERRLLSRGSVFFRLTQGGRVLTPGRATLSIKAPARAARAGLPLLFIGYPTAERTLNWALINPQDPIPRVLAGIVQPDSMPISVPAAQRRFYQTYIFGNNPYHWVCAADYADGEPTGRLLELELPKEFTRQNTDAYALSADSLLILPMDPVVDIRHFRARFRLPAGHGAQVVAVAKREGSYYTASYEEGLLADTSLVRLIPQQQTLDQARAWLSGLE